MIKNVGVDTGYGYGLMVCANKRVKVASFIEEIKEEQAKSLASNVTLEDVKNGKKLVIKYTRPLITMKETKYYVVGEYAENTISNASRFVTDNRVGDEKHLIQLLSLIGLAVSTQNADINLGMGYPTKLKYEKDDMEKWLTDRFEIAYLYNKGQLKRNLNIQNVIAIGQSSAPIFTLEDNQLEGNVLSLDFGHNTNDYLYWKAGNFQSKYERDARGFRHHYSDMADLLLRRFHRVTKNFKEATVQKALETGRIKLRDGEHNVEDFQLEILNTYADEIIKEITTIYQEILDEVDIVLLSGGIVENDKFYEIFKEKSKSLMLPLVRPDDAQWNVVNGLYVIISSQFEEE